jgi:hypothetical protein
MKTDAARLSQNVRLPPAEALLLGLSGMPDYGSKLQNSRSKPVVRISQSWKPVIASQGKLTGRPTKVAFWVAASEGGWTNCGNRANSLVSCTLQRRKQGTRTLMVWPQGLA